MNKLSLSKRAQLIGMLVEGNSLRATARMSGVSYNAVLKFLGDIGRACSEYQDTVLRDLPCKNIQVDEIWSFCYAKEKNLARAKSPVEGAGNVWTWTAICADTRLVPTWFVGTREIDAARQFVHDLASRLKNRVQLTSDGYGSYLSTVEEAFGVDVDFGMLVKSYGTQGTSKKERYLGATRQTITGKPEVGLISTSYVERQNLTMRMGMRRFTRRTNGHSKKIESHEHAIALHFMHYNFGRIHQTLRITPAMEASISDHVWSLEEIAGLLDAYEVPKKRGTYKYKHAPNFPEISRLISAANKD